MAHTLPGRGQRTKTNKATKARKVNIDETGGLPQMATTRSMQDYKISTRRKSKANPGYGKMGY